MTPAPLNNLSDAERQDLVLGVIDWCYRLAAQFVAYCHTQRGKPLPPADVEDLHQFAFYSACYAAQRWMPDRGIKFNTYVTYCIQNNFKRWGLSTKPKGFRCRKNKGESSHGMDHFPMPEHDWIEERWREEKAAEYMRVLTKIEQHVIMRRIYEGRTLSEIGREMGLSQERIRQLEQRSLYKMRKVAGVIKEKEVA